MGSVYSKLLSSQNHATPIFAEYDFLIAHKMTFFLLLAFGQNIILLRQIDFISKAWFRSQNLVCQ